MRRPEFGVRLPVAGPLAGAAAIARTAQRAEELGFDALWVHDYIVWTRELDRTHISCGSAEMFDGEVTPNFFESLTTLAFVAGLTRSIRIGTAVLCLPYRRPIEAAKQLANLDVLSDGRLILGVGVGANRRTHNQDFEVLGIPRAEKYERAADYIRLMREIWTSDRPSYQGQFVQMPETEVFPKPIQKPGPPVWLGGSGPKAMDLIATFADGWLPTWFTPEDYRDRLPALYASARDHGRPDARFTIGNEIVACIAPDDEGAERISRATIETLSSGFMVRTVEQAAASALVGSPASIARRVRAFHEAGVDHFELKFIYQTVDHLLEQMDLFSREVLPVVR
jgi:probable F420-dependent oxidoreductase